MGGSGMSRSHSQPTFRGAPDHPECVCWTALCLPVPPGLCFSTMAASGAESTWNLEREPGLRPLGQD